MITRIKEKERISDHANTGTIHPIAQANSPLRPPAHADDHTAVRVGACRRVRVRQWSRAASILPAGGRYGEWLDRQHSSMSVVPPAVSRCAHVRTQLRLSYMCVCVCVCT